MNGQAKRYREDGTLIYEGEYKDDEWEGNGVYYTPNGDIYRGNFKQRKFHGQGKYTYANGEVYTGKWIDDKLEGVKHFKKIIKNWISTPPAPVIMLRIGNDRSHDNKLFRAVVWDVWDWT